MNKYSEIEKILLNQGRFYISLELDRITAILKLLGNPQEKIKIIHVAGTNGKGSVCATLSQILISQGYKVGTYTSPHLVKYNERIKINNTPITDDNFYEIIIKITDLAKENQIHLTEFEILTATMYLYFAQNKVDIAVVEVGLGGRFDATNCITAPILCIIVSISLDHTERLGDTIEKIAFEKAGIIKNNSTIIVNDNNTGLEIFKKIALNNNAKIITTQTADINFQNGLNTVKYGENKYEYSLLGQYQKQNISLVLKAVEILNSKGLKITDNAIKEGLKTVKWSCRFEYFKNKNIILDGCHNPDGAKVLKESLDFYFPENKRIFVYTSLKNKDYKNIQKNLFRKEDTIYYFQTDSHNFISANDVKNAVKSLNITDLKELIKSKNHKDLLIICGSLYALGDVLGKIDLCS